MHAEAVYQIWLFAKEDLRVKKWVHVPFPGNDYSPSVGNRERRAPAWHHFKQQMVMKKSRAGARRSRYFSQKQESGTFVVQAIETHSINSP
ncbi:MAG: hypothetical protein KJ645_05160, partial [Planctomycetes bacterium]|nr:hypothetical protein [Planctomycetota bacterium]